MSYTRNNPTASSGHFGGSGSRGYRDGSQLGTQGTDVADNQELLVFGYSCKIFRDDVKALEVDSGKTLIPWMGDESLRIDRYDVRATLWNLREWESPPGGFDPFHCLTMEQKQIEELCDQERYMFIREDADDEALRQEEELKRLRIEIQNDPDKSYAQVPFSYDTEQMVSGKEEGNGDAAGGEADAPLVEEPEEPFIAPPGLHIPPQLKTPKTLKSYQIIVKTASFVSSQGPQMEIVLRAKQAKNPQFSFLSFDDPLHPFYSHMVTAIRSKYFVPEAQSPAEMSKPSSVKQPKKEELPTQTIQQEEEESDDSDNSDHYLHPSLVGPVNPTPPTPPVEKGLLSQPRAQAIPADSPYARIISTFQTKNLIPKSTTNSASSSTPPTPEEMLVIDKMAAYVAKNGAHFQEMMKSQDDPRFQFLYKSHSHFPLYKSKLKQYKAAINKTNTTEAASSETEQQTAQGIVAGGVTGVSFSIRKETKHTKKLLAKPVLPVVLSDEEQGSDHNSETGDKPNQPEGEVRSRSATRSPCPPVSTAEKTPTGSVPGSPSRSSVSKEPSPSPTDGIVIGGTESIEEEEHPVTEIPTVAPAPSSLPLSEEKIKELRRKKLAMFLSRLKQKEEKGTESTPQSPIVAAVVSPGNDDDEQLPPSTPPEPGQRLDDEEETESSLPLQRSTTGDEEEETPSTDLTVPPSEEDKVVNGTMDTKEESGTEMEISSDEELLEEIAENEKEEEELVQVVHSHRGLFAEVAKAKLKVAKRRKKAEKVEEGEINSDDEEEEVMMAAPIGSDDETGEDDVVVVSSRSQKRKKKRKDESPSRRRYKRKSSKKRKRRGSDEDDLEEDSSRKSRRNYESSGSPKRKKRRKSRTKERKHKKHRHREEDLESVDVASDGKSTPSLSSGGTDASENHAAAASSDEEVLKAVGETTSPKRIAKIPNWTSKSEVMNKGELVPTPSIMDAISESLKQKVDQLVRSSKPLASLAASSSTSSAQGVRK